MAKAPTQTPDDPDVEIEQTEGGGRKKLMLIGAIALVLLLGAGAAAYFVLAGPDEPPAEGEPVAEPPEPEGEPTYHKLDPVFVVNLPPGGRAKMLQVGLQVYTRDPALVEHLERHEPMLRHHLFDVLSAQRADDLFERSGRERLQAALEDKLREKLREAGVDKPRISAVYFTQFVLQ